MKLRMIRELASRVSGALVLAALSAAGAAMAGDDSWTDIIGQAMTIPKGLTMQQAMSGQRGVTMEMVQAFAGREPQFAGFAPWMETHFTAVDANGDRMVTMEEMYVWMDGNGVTDAQLTEAWYGKGR